MCPRGKKKRTRSGALNEPVCPFLSSCSPPHTHTLAPYVVTVSRHVWALSFLSLGSVMCSLCDVSQPKDPHIRLSSLQSCEADRPVLFVKHPVCAIIKQP